MRQINAVKPRIVRISVDRKGRISFTAKLDKRLYLTVRSDGVTFDAKHVAEYVDSGESRSIAPIKTGQHVYGAINFIARWSTLSNRIPARPKVGQRGRNRASSKIGRGRGSRKKS